MPHDASFQPDQKQLAESAELLKALAHPVRLCIVQGLLACGGCNVTHIRQCLSLPQSTVSQQLARLRRAGIVVGERRGLEVCYRVTNDVAAAVVRTLTKDATG